MEKKKKKNKKGKKKGKKEKQKTCWYMLTLLPYCIVA